MQTITTCPVCGGAVFSQFAKCKDYTVSHETFNLSRCVSCNLMITSPRPLENDLVKYYQSINYVSHGINEKSLFDKIYQISRHFTLAWKLNIIKRFSSSGGRRVLDVGCGTGEFLHRAKQKGFTISGVEPSDTGRAKAEKLTRQKIHSNLKEAVDAFDIITLWHVLEHVPDLNNYLTELKQKLSKNGTMFIAVPNHQSRDAKHYGDKWAGYDVPRHLWHFNKESMKKLLSKHDLKLETIIGMKLDSFYVSMLSEKHAGSGLAGMIKGFFQGLQSNLHARQTKEYSSLIYVIRK